VIRSFRIVGSFDVFNATNANTVLAANRQQVADNANRVSGILAPRIARVGVTAHW